MEIWDTGGQERFRTITKSYYGRAMGVIFVFDSTSEQSFQDIRHWVTQIQQHAHAQIAKLLVAAKCDLPDKKVTTEAAQAMASEFGMNYIETSAKDNRNVTEMFQAIATQICTNGVDYSTSKRSTLIASTADQPVSKKKKCC